MGNSAGSWDSNDTLTEPELSVAVSSVQLADVEFSPTAIISSRSEGQLVNLGSSLSVKKQK